jgi:hypothetical protein
MVEGQSPSVRRRALATDAETLVRYFTVSCSSYYRVSSNRSLEIYLSSLTTAIFTFFGGAHFNDSMK